MALLTPLVAFTACDSGTTEPIPPQPSFVVILTDDLDWKSMPYLPRLQRLADEGVTFRNFFVTTPVCAPSRATMLRGQYAHNHGVLVNSGAMGGYDRFRELGRESSTVATWLHSAGYRTAFLGKYMNGYPDFEAHVPVGWDEWFATFDKYFNFRANDNGCIVEYQGPDNYETDVIASRAAEFIRAAAAAQAPFLLYISTHAPHGPANPAPRHAGEFAGVTAPRSPSFNEEDISDKPSWIAARPQLTQAEIDEIDEFFRQRLRSMLAVDEMIDTLVNTLAATGRAQQTYIFFTSDNGYHLGEHRFKKGKTNPYDEDVRVPLLVYGPGIGAGRQVSEIGLNIDIAPTLTALAGLPAPSFVDGRSLVPLLSGIQGAPGAGRAGLLIEWLKPDKEYIAVRDASYLYVHHFGRGELELYDRRLDPYELDNSYPTADPDFLGDLSAWLGRLKLCAGAGCRSAEDQP
jgi:arylsulfatase A-like enzyme